jgi:S1-C subfamily serine protease
MTRTCRPIWIFALLLLARAAVGAGDAVRDAIVKIYAVRNSPDFYNPWNMKGMQATTGSGCIIPGKRILTNAHVVSDRTYLQVRRNGEAQRFTARVLAVSHEADLALIEVEDPSFFGEVAPLELGDLPEVQSEVAVYGFPMGGDTLSITKGVISRIENQTYIHSAVSMLAGQIDAAINPGNSGGPVIAGGRVVGVVMQGMPQAQNIGYMVPPNVIRHFFKDLEDGRYDGFPSLGLVQQEMENPDLRRYVNMSEGQTGLLVVKVLPGSAADGAVQPGDVLLSVAGQRVANDGTIEFRPRERTSIHYLVQARQVGETIDIEVLRGTDVRPLKIELKRSLAADPLVPFEMYDRLPSYYVYGGLVFCPLTRNYLGMWGQNWVAAAPRDLVAILGWNVPETEGEQVVVAIRTLAADCNQGYHELSSWIVTTVDGQRVRRLEDLVRAVESPAAASPYVVFSNEKGHRLVLDRAKAEKENARILATYRIERDRSEDMPIKLALPSAP